MSEAKLQSSLPLESLRTLLEFARGAHKLDKCVAAAGLSVVSYSLDLVLPEHGAPSSITGQSQVTGGSVVDELELAVASATEPALGHDGEVDGYVSAPKIDWKKIAEFVITVIIKAVL